MAVASLAILGDVDEQYVYEATYILSSNFKTLIARGLDCYAPDGSYNEGPGYWNYGTNNFFRMCAALDSATGGNYGLMDCWGMDTTCYYACHTEDNDGRYFPFHDGSVGQQDIVALFYHIVQTAVAGTEIVAQLVVFVQIDDVLKHSVQTDSIDRAICSHTIQNPLAPGILHRIGGMEQAVVPEIDLFFHGSIADFDHFPQLLLCNCKFSTGIIARISGIYKE
jgi:hypothetical protein